MDTPLIPLDNFNVLLNFAQIVFLAGLVWKGASLFRGIAVAVANLERSTESLAKEIKEMATTVNQLVTETAILMDREARRKATHD